MNDESAKIVGEVGAVMARMERRIVDEMTPIKVGIATLTSQHEAFTRQCDLKHKGVDADFLAVRKDVGEVKQAQEDAEEQENTAIRTQLKEARERRAFWSRQLVLQVVGLMLGGGGIALVIEIIKWKVAH